MTENSKFYYDESRFPKSLDWPRPPEFASGGIPEWVSDWMHDLLAE